MFENFKNFILKMNLITILSILYFLFFHFNFFSLVSGGLINQSESGLMKNNAIQKFLNFEKRNQKEKNHGGKPVPTAGKGLALICPFCGGNNQE
jgi:hypothetical protein